MTKATPRPLAGPLRGRAWLARSEELTTATTVDLISDKPNRWNVDGEPTIYLSGDPALALLETGRHPDDLEERAEVFEVEVRVPLAVDIRDRAVRSALSLPDDLGWVLDRRRTRHVARTLRHSGMCDGLIVPSAGALDQEGRFNVVVFADDRTRIPRMVTGLRRVGDLRLSLTTV